MSEFNLRNFILDKVTSFSLFLMECPVCGYKNYPDNFARFCPICGEDLKVGEGHKIISDCLR